MREGHPISAAENRAIHAWYSEHGENNHSGRNISKPTLLCKWQSCRSLLHPIPISCGLAKSNLP